MIVIGYQGIGKSTLVKYSNSYIDFESSNFKINGKRPDEWEQMYCEAALDLSRQGHVVFTASHKCIRDYLKYHQESEDVLIVAPSVDLKDQWLEKLRNRYKETGLLKDRLALLNAEDCFDENIKEMQNYASVFPFYEITDMGYKLRYLFDNLLKDEEVLKTFGFKRLQVYNVVYGEEGRKLESAACNASPIENELPGKIGKLEAENKRLREALQMIATEKDNHGQWLSVEQAAQISKDTLDGELI